MSAPKPVRRPSPRRLTAAGVADLFIPGLGHAFVGRPRAAALFFIPFGLAVAGLLVLYFTGGFTAILAWVVTPGVLPLLILSLIHI